MKNGYEIFWTTNALNELEKTISYLAENFTEKEIRKLAIKIELIIALISQQPTIFPKSDFNNIYKAVVLKYNTLYYRINKDKIEILSFFSNRQHPTKRNI